MLDNGIISYYDSQDDVCKGSKGSIKMSVCEIKGEIIICLIRKISLLSLRENKLVNLM